VKNVHIVHNVHSKNVHNAHPIHNMHNAYVPHAMIASSSCTSFVHGRIRHNGKPISVPKKRNASTDPPISYHTFDASYILHCKSGKVVATYVGPRHKNGKTCV
jgi:hypothetical protein